MNPETARRCDCGQDLSAVAAPLAAQRQARAARPASAGSPKGFAYSYLADVALLVGATCAFFGCVLTVIWTIAAATKGLVGIALIAGTLGFFLQLAMVVVFLRVRDIRG